MFNAMTIRTKHDSVRDRMQTPGSLGDAMVNIASCLAPSAPLTLIPVVANGRLRPRVTSPVATLAIAYRVAFPVVPRAVPKKSGFGSL